MTGWEISEWAGAVIAVVGAVSILWAKVIKPVRRFLANLVRFMHRMEEAVEWVETQMRPNHGSTLVDKVDQVYRSVVGVEPTNLHTPGKTEQKEPAHGS
jgi:flagellar biosynthesis/type III secretory pathway M-ring protein FliF/YscJ